MAFIPPYPTPHKTKSSFFLRFVRGWHSWLHVLFERSYSMKMGQLRQPGRDVFMVNDPKWIRHIMVDQWAKYPKHEIMHRVLEPLLGVSIFTTNGEVWERQRRLVDQGFQQARLQHVFPLMRKSIAGMLDRMDLAADGRSYEVDGEMTYITADIMFRTILSEDLDQADAEVIYKAFLEFQGHAQRAVMLIMYRLPDYFPRRASKKCAKQIRTLISALIARRYEERDKGEKAEKMDILGAIMNATDPVKGDRFSYEETVDQICMLFLAGHETSASALAWALYLLSHNPT
ncbi:MAG TPA: cytochrome P450, partial [Chthoniobacterales bacterium]